MSDLEVNDLMKALSIGHQDENTINMKDFLYKLGLLDTGGKLVIEDIRAVIKKSYFWHAKSNVYESQSTRGLKKKFKAINTI